MGFRGTRGWVFRDNFGRGWRVWFPEGDQSATPVSAAARSRGAHAIHSLIFFASTHGQGDELARSLLSVHESLTGHATPSTLSAVTPARWREIEDTLATAVRHGTLRVEAQSLGRGIAGEGAEKGEDKPPAPLPPAGTSDGTTWFALEVLDEVGDPIDGLDVTYTVSGERRAATTNGAGIARIDGVNVSSFASVAIKSLDQVRQKLRPRWQEQRDPKRFEDPDIVIREIGDTVTQSLSLENEKQQTLVITPYFKCHEIPGAHFAFGRSFVLAEAIENLAAIAEDLSADDGRKGMVFGHTDLAGPDALNKELSERRARAVLALFTHDADAWEELSSGSADGQNWHEKWDLEEAQHMLNALHVTDDDGSAINEKGVRDAPTRQAIHRFRSADYPEKPAEQAPLPPSDFLGKDGRKELFLAYAKLISRKPIDKARFAKIGDASFMGCGEFNPLSITVKDKESRRAVVFVFDAAAGPKALPCKLRNLGPCKANSGPLPTEVDPKKPPYRCKIYESIATKCPCQGGADLSHDLIIRVPFPLEVVNTFDHVLIVESDDGTISRTKTLKSDARALDPTESEVYFTDLPPIHQYRMRAEGVPEPYEVFPFTPFEQLSTLTEVDPPIDEDKLASAAIAADPGDPAPSTDGGTPS